MRAKLHEAPRIIPERQPLRERLSFALSAIARRATGAIAAVVAPGVLIALMLLAGAACLVTGVAMLAGQAWAFVAAGLLLFLLAGIALRGAA